MRRIKVLDSFRFLAITLVALFHYYSRWTQPISDTNLYPYGGKYKNLLFDNGFLGVQFFFVISGFVIYFTLDRSKNGRDFLLKRLIRLYPTLLLCSIITFIVDKFLFKGVYFPHSWWSFGFSLTFIDPALLNNFFHFTNPNSSLLVDTVYWSLVVEVKFYLIVALVYFIFSDREKFFRNYLAFYLVLSAIYFCSEHWLLGMGRFRRVLENLFIIRHLPFFTYGILFYSLYSKKIEWKGFLQGLKTDNILFLVTAGLLGTHCLSSIPLAILVSVTTFLFLSMIYKPAWLVFLDRPWLSRIGFTSYSIYLLHQQIGVELINFLTSFLHITSARYLIPILVFGLIILAAEVIYRYFEKPMKERLYLWLGLARPHPSYVPSPDPLTRG